MLQQPASNLCLVLSLDIKMLWLKLKKIPYGKIKTNFKNRKELNMLFNWEKMIYTKKYGTFIQKV